jgi:hypothetical protein
MTKQTTTATSSNRKRKLQRMAASGRRVNTIVTLDEGVGDDAEHRREPAAASIDDDGILSSHINTENFKHSLR